MRRPVLLALIALGVLAFLFISTLLTRGFSVDSAERSALTSVVTAEAHGDRAGVLARMPACAHSALCRANVAADVAALRHPGAVSVIQIQGSDAFSVLGARSTARIAWTVDSGLPIVQCVRVTRHGDVLAGFRVELRELSRRIKSDAACPAKF